MTVLPLDVHAGTLGEMDLHLLRIGIQRGAHAVSMTQRTRAQTRPQAPVAGAASVSFTSRYSVLGIPMKAVVIARYGGPEVLEVREVPDPQPRAGELLVRVEAAGVNFADILAAKGGYPGTPPPPLIAGREFCGRREDTGQRVMGYTQSQAFAERIAIRPEFVWPTPEKWSAEECAAFPVNFFTAYLAYWKAGLTADSPAEGGQGTKVPRRVLIHAVAGGVGTAAVQIGRILGIETFGSSSSDEKLERVKALGLTHAINYTR